jgi:hypothetical protein
VVVKLTCIPDRVYASMSPFTGLPQPRLPCWQPLKSVTVPRAAVRVPVLGKLQPMLQAVSPLPELTLD